MDFKDNRSKDKRTKMKHRKGKPPAIQRVTYASNDSSSSYQVEAVRGYVDVADTSDERFCGHASTRWLTQPPLQDMDELDLRDKELEEYPQLSAGDYNIMSQMPTSVGHFQFASEKSWNNEDESLLNAPVSEYFTLNAKLLNVGLRTIPFYKRMDFDASMFTHDQLLTMDQAAEAAEKEYQSVLNEHLSNPKIKINSASGRRTASAKSQISTKVESKKEQQEDDELDELLNMSTTNSVAKLSLNDDKKATDVAETTVGTAEANEDIQQWLDNVLEK